jgi:hypothetical protein
LSNVLNPNEILIGTGPLYINGQSVGQLTGDVTYSYTPEEKEIKAGYPQQVVKSAVVGESATLKAAFLEINMDRIADLLPLFTKEIVSAGITAVTNEWLGAINAASWVGAANRRWTSAAVTAQLASKLTAVANAGATKIYVTDASLFTAGDAILLVKSGTTEAATIDADGVDTDENSLTLTAGITNAFSAGDFAKNTTVAPVSGTDFLYDPINGCVARVSGSTVIGEGDTVAIGYTYTQVSAIVLYGGGNVATAQFPMEFWHTQDDGKIHKIKFPKGQLTGAFELPFKETDVCILNVTIKSVSDSTKAAGKQLVEHWLENPS